MNSPNPPSGGPSLVPLPDVSALGAELRHRREVLHLTQAAAAGLTGVSHRLWSEVERGARPNVSLNTVLRMLQTIGLDLALRPRTSGDRSGKPSSQYGKGA